MDVAIILNPAAGKGRGARRYAAMGGLPEAWRGAEVQVTSGSGHAAVLAERAARAGARLLVVAGGDGTLHESVNGLMRVPESDRPTLAHLPVGTGCDFARGIGLVDETRRPVGDPERWRPRAVDIVEIESGDGTRRWFVNAANVGLGPTVARWVGHPAWRGAGRAAYEVAAAVAILASRPRLLRLRYDGIEVEAPTLNLSICNGPYFGGGMQPCPRARADDGKLDGAWVGDIGRLAALVRLPGLMRGRLREHPRLRRFTTRELSVQGEGAVEADGEIAAALPVIFRVRAGAVRVLCPVAGHAGRPSRAAD